MATTATDQANSSKRGSHDARDAKTEVGKKSGGAGHGDVKDRTPPQPPRQPAPQTEPLDSAAEDPYDNIACTD